MGTDPVSISIGDFNGDGKSDIALISRISSSVSVLLGNGDGTFQIPKSTNISTGQLADSLAIGDFNGDGKLDIATTVSLPQIGLRAVAVLLGNGDGTFQAPVNYDVGSGAQFAAVADFNSDGKLDIAVADFNANAISILLGKGDGTFQPAVNTPAGLRSTLQVGPISVADFNHDGKPDIVMANSSLSNFVVFLGNGDGSFAAPLMTGVSVSIPFSVAAFSVAAGDFNGDGLPDVAVLGDGGLVVFLGKGDGTFQQSAAFVLEPQQSVAAVIADLNGDGKIDLAVPDGVSDGVSVAFGNGDGTFQVAKIVPTPAPFSIPPSGALFALTADLNGDGKLDLVVAGGNRGNGNLGVLLGTGDGSFQAPLNTLVASGLHSFSGPVAVGDLNQDGKPDLVVAFPDPGAIGILIGNGDGTFQPLAQYAAGVVSVGIGDFNGDGKPDVIAADGQGNLSLLIANGDGTFGFAKTIPTGNANAGFLAVGDFNNDGKLDVAMAGTNVAILLGNGDGTFQQSTNSAIAGLPSNIAVGDFNHDGNLDVVVTIPDQFDQAAPPPLNTVAVLLGNGNGTLQPAVYYPVGVAPHFVTVGDLNNDGRLDLVTANLVSGDVSILLGNGDGSFQSAENFGANGFGLSAAIGDFNGDGAPDIAVAAGLGGVSILTNRDVGPAPAAALAPSLVGFGSQAIGLASGARSVTLNNTGSAVLNIAGISLSGPQASDFSQTNTCGINLAAAGNCTFNITFTPSALGTRIASIVITDNAFSSPQIISLSGAGVAVAPGAGLAPGTLTFAGELVGTASTPQIITLTNTGNASLTISNIAITGANSGDFAQTNTCPASPATLAAQANCSISVIFKPSVTGNRAASVTITDNASGSPQGVSLTGTGIAPTVTLAPTSLNFANQLLTTTSSAQTITLTNRGTATLNIASIAIAGANSGDFAQTNACPASSAKLAAGANCTISVTFTPSVTGNRTASVSITDDASGSPQSIALTGMGTDFSLDAASGSNCPAGGNCSIAAVVTTGQTAAYNLQVSPVSGFNGNVALTCSGAPAPSTCAISPALVPPNGSSSYAFTVTINNTSSVMTLPLTTRPNAPQWPTARFVSPLFMIFGMGLMLAGLVMAQTRRQRVPMPILAVLLLGFLCACGCGGGGSGTTVHPPTTATITVTGTSGGVSRTLHLSLTVNH